MATTDTKASRTWPKIIPVTIKGVQYYRVDARRKGTNGKRETFSTKKAAEDRAKEIRDDVKIEGLAGLSIDAELRAMAKRGDSIMKRRGKTIMDAVLHYDAFLDAEEAKASGKTITALADEWLENKRTGSNRKLRPHTLRGIKQHSQYLKKHFGEKKLVEISDKVFQKHLDGLGEVGQLRKRHIANLTGQFFNWCIDQEYTSANPAKKIVKKIHIPAVTPTILNEAQALNTMKITTSKEHESLKLYAALAMFAGLRPTECELLKWDNIHLEEKQIFVPKEISKISEDRNVPIEDNLYAWLAAYQGERKGFVTDQKNLNKRLRALRAAMGYRVNGHNEDAEPWDADAFRHSYASYWLGKYKDRAHLAENMGNSIQVIKKHYKQVVSTSAVAAFWGIVPAAVEKEGDAVGQSV